MKLRTEAPCVVCSVDRDRFVRFAPCTGDCKGKIYFRTSNEGDERQPQRGRSLQTYCHADPSNHRPDRKERFHRDYCSLRCYNDPWTGHRIRAAIGQKRRDQRRPMRDYSKNTTIKLWD